MPIPHDLFTTREVADRLGLARATVQDAIAKGRMAVVRIDGRTVAVSGAEIERYRREHLGRVGRPKAKK